MLPFQTQTLSIPPTKITNDTCKNFTPSLPTQTFKTSVTAVKAACTCKLLQLLQLLPDRCMVRLIMELIGNRSFTLTAANGKWGRLRRLKNCVPQGFGLAHSSSTSTPLTCQPPSPESMHDTQTTYQSCILS